MIPVNIQRADELMASANLDAIVATSPTNVGYLTGYFLSLDPLFKEFMVDPGSSGDAAFPTYGVLALAGRPALVVNAAFAANAALVEPRDVHPYGDLVVSPGEALFSSAVDRQLWEVLRSAGNRTAIEALVAVLEGSNLTNGRVGIELEPVSEEVSEQLRRALPRAVIRDCTNLFRVLRAVKTPAEIDTLAAAAACSLQAAAEATERIRPGITVRELIDEYRVSLAQSGADLAHFVVGRSGLGLTSDPSYSVPKAQAVAIDFGCVRDHYFSDAAWTISFSQPSTRVASWIDALRHAVDAGAQALRPGVNGSQISDVMTRVLTAQRVSGHTLPHGHGIGLEVRDYPILVPPNERRIRDGSIDRPSDMELEPGMVLSLEVSSYLPGLGSLVDERSFVIETTTARPLVAPQPAGGTSASRAEVMPGQT